MELSQNNNSSSSTSSAAVRDFPPGYRFWPTDVELLVYYLSRKIRGLDLPPNLIIDCNIYDYSPDWLSERFRPIGMNEWYFFSPRNKKYRNGTRPDRVAGTGYWKATGSDKKVHNKGQVVGSKKTLCFLIGKPPTGKKTNWLMHEFRVPNAPAPQRKDNNDMKLDEWVLCKIYRSRPKSDQEKNQPEGEAVTGINVTINNNSFSSHETCDDKQQSLGANVAFSSNTNLEPQADIVVDSTKNDNIDRHQQTLWAIFAPCNNTTNSIPRAEIASNSTQHLEAVAGMNVGADGAYSDNSYGSMQYPSNADNDQSLGAIVASCSNTESEPQADIFADFADLEFDIEPSGPDQWVLVFRKSK